MSKPYVIEQMLGDSGFNHITIEEMRVDWSHDSFEDAWDFMSKVAGPITRLVKELPGDQLGTLRNAMKEKLEPFRAGTGITLPGVTLNAWAS